MDIRVLIISPIRIYRQGIADFLASRGGITRVDAVSQFKDMAIECKQHVHNVILVDMAVEGACNVIRRIDQLAPDIRVIALAVSEAEEEIAACAQAGVAGLVTRDASLDDVVRCIDAAARHELLCPKPVADVLLRQARESTVWSVKHGATTCLSKQESRILHYIREGYSNKEIARTLSIEVSTVKNHVHHILRKLNVQRRGEAAALVTDNRTYAFPVGPDVSRV